MGAAAPGSPGVRGARELKLRTAPVRVPRAPLLRGTAELSAPETADRGPRLPVAAAQSPAGSLARRGLGTLADCVPEVAVGQVRVTAIRALKGHPTERPSLRENSDLMS